MTKVSGGAVTKVTNAHFLGSCLVHTSLSVEHRVWFSLAAQFIIMCPDMLTN